MCGDYHSDLSVMSDILPVTIYLHVAPSPGRHITSLSISVKFYHFIIL